MSKTHYRNVFKSDHLGSADLEDLIEKGIKLIFTIKEVKQEFNVAVAGRKGNFNIAYFKEKIKPLVLNATNSKIIRGFCNSAFVEDWKDVIIELYVDDNVKAVTGGKTQGVRIRTLQPKVKQKPEFTEANFEKAKNAKATIEMILKSYSITDEIKNKYLEYVGAEK